MVGFEGSINSSRDLRDVNYWAMDGLGWGWVEGGGDRRGESTRGGGGGVSDTSAPASIPSCFELISCLTSFETVQTPYSTINSSAQLLLTIQKLYRSPTNAHWPRLRL